MEHSSDVITPETLCACRTCGTLLYGADLCAWCVVNAAYVEAKTHAAWAAELFGHQRRIDADALAQERRDRTMRCRVWLSIFAVYVGLFAGGLYWLFRR